MLTDITEFNETNSVQVEVEILCENVEEKFSLRMPESRMDRRILKPRNITRSLQEFQGKIQDEFNNCPVGPYQGPYDQNPQVPLRAQLHKSNLSYRSYTHFSHPHTLQCKTFKIKKDYENYSDLHKIKALDIVEDSNEHYTKPNDDDDDRKVFYTYTQNRCFIPCPCHSCSSKKRQCTTHNIKHIDTFNEKDDAISVRSSDNFCYDKTFFLSSYILKYPGIPKNCSQCQEAASQILSSGFPWGL